MHVHEHGTLQSLMSAHTACRTRNVHVHISEQQAVKQGHLAVPCLCGFDYIHVPIALT